MQIHSFRDYIRLLSEDQEEEAKKEEERDETEDGVEKRDGDPVADVKSVRDSLKNLRKRIQTKRGAGTKGISKALKTVTRISRSGAMIDRKSGMGSLRNELLHTLKKESVSEAVKAELVGYEWRTTDGVRYSAREEGMVDGKVSDWSRSETSEISRKKIVHIYWIKGEDGKVKPYGKHSALKALGMYYDRELERKIKPFVDKIQHDQIAIRNQFAEWKTNIEYMKKSGRPDCSSDDPKSLNYHLTKLSAKPSRVWRFASHIAQRESVKVSEACVFFKLEGYWACFSVGEGKNDVSRANVLAYLEANKIKEIPFREFMAAVKKDTYD